jgi:kojibiose phosphorylase
VVTDTAALHSMAWRRLAEEEGLVFDATATEAMRGLSRDDSLRHILGGRSVPQERFDELAQRKNTYYLVALDRAGEDIVLPGVRLLLAGLRELGIRLAAVSLSRNARSVLLRARLIDAFDVVLDGADLANGKADLNRYVRAAAVLRVEPWRCVVVEDSSAGVAAARAAGMQTVGVGDYDRLSAATMIFESLRGVDAGTLVYWLANRRRA